jgi:hypothetical protein
MDSREAYEQYAYENKNSRGIDFIFPFKAEFLYFCYIQLNTVTLYTLYNWEQHNCLLVSKVSQ